MKVNVAVLLKFIFKINHVERSEKNTIDDFFFCLFPVRLGHRLQESFDSFPTLTKTESYMLVVYNGSENPYGGESVCLELVVAIGHIWSIFPSPSDPCLKSAILFGYCSEGQAC